MLEFLKRVFGKQKVEIVEPVVLQIGGKYVRNNTTGDPFATPHYARVVDLKNGWVQYNIDDASLKWSEKQEIFTHLYKCN
jgi:hypothetical protein